MSRTRILKSEKTQTHTQTQSNRGWFGRVPMGTGFVAMPIDFELDSIATRDAFHSCNTDVTEFGSIIKACRELFSSSFANSKVEFIRRQTNAAAHALAREVTSLVSPFTYYVIPSCIETIIINEML